MLHYTHDTVQFVSKIKKKMLKNKLDRDKRCELRSYLD